uniref:Uncharacterized protein n=1 Tax=Lepeophtheirus salmonis TaxID=72036 RepID=A0A0K2V4F2_LEPSM
MTDSHQAMMRYMVLIFFPSQDVAFHNTTDDITVSFFDIFPFCMQLFLQVAEFILIILFKGRILRCCYGVIFNARSYY